MQNYVVNEPPELVLKINDLVKQIQQFWNEKKFIGAEDFFKQYYELMRLYEEKLPEGKRFHKGTPLHNWGVSILLQNNPLRKNEGLGKIFLAYIEDLLDFDDIQQVQSAPAYKTLAPIPFYTELLASAEARVKRLIALERILKNPEDILTRNLDRDAQSATQKTNRNKPKIVFVVHGRNIKAKTEMYSFLKSLKLIPINVSETITRSEEVTPYVGQIIDMGFSLAQAVMVLMTPDDIGFLRKKYWKPDDEPFESKLTPQARLNVIFEAGLAMGGEFHNRTIIVELGKIRELSDLKGRLVVRLDNNEETRRDLVARLRNSKCDLDDSDNLWKKEGDFQSVIEDELDPTTSYRYRLARFILGMK